MNVEVNGPASRLRKALAPALPLLHASLAAVIVAAFHATARVYYRGFVVPQGYGMEFLLPQELTHFALFFAFGFPAWILLTLALRATSLPAAALAAARKLSRRLGWAAVVAAVGVTFAGVLLGHEVLGGGVLSDDEYVYRFIAQTLRTGSLTAASPGGDFEFYLEQFVVMTDKVRYGKYPIGFPLLLAVGQAVRAERVVVPVLTGVLALLVAWVGRRAFSPSVALAGVILFALSPQVLLTAPSLLSQPASAVCLMGALGCLLAVIEREQWEGGWAAAAGALLGFGILTRPLPGALFAGVAILALGVPSWTGAKRRLTPANWATFLLPLLALGPAAILWVNGRQSGDAFVSGYHVVHGAEWGSSLLFHGTLARWAMALVSNVVRLNFWLFGWPLSLIFCPFARRTPATRLFWAMIWADVAYRFLAPKAGIGTAGPIYFYEMVPLLCLLSGDGIAAVGRRLEGWGIPGLRSAVAAPGLAAAVLAGCLVDVTLFLPFKLGDMARAGEGERAVFQEVGRRNIHHALVFHRGVVPPWTGLSWAYYPPPNSPALDDDVLFVVLQPDILANVEFWKRRYPDRQAWLFVWNQQEGISLVPLESLLSPPPPSATGVPAPSGP